MNVKFYKTNKIKSGRPRCPLREAAALRGAPQYVDKNWVTRFTCSGNAVKAKYEWDTNKRRSCGALPPKPKAPPEVISKKNVANVKRWRKNNPDKARAARSKENFIRRSAVRDRFVLPITAEFLIAQRQFQRDNCAYCIGPLYGAGHQDHVFPVSRGGAHAPYNIVWACEPCNLRKGSKLGWKPFWE